MRLLRQVGPNQLSLGPLVSRVSVPRTGVLVVQLPGWASPIPSSSLRASSPWVSTLPGAPWGERWWAPQAPMTCPPSSR